MAEDNVQALVAELSLNSKRIERQQNRLLKKFDTTFNSIEKTGRKRLANVERRAEEMSRNVRRAIAAIALGIAGREVTSYADAWTDLNNKVKAAGEVSGIQGRAMKELAADARATRSEIEPYVDLYSRILRAGKGVAESEAEVARVTQITAKAFAAGGASASEQAAGVLQLGQALGSGFLQGDELRSLRENAPLVAKAVADAMGVSIGGLKELGAQGKITSDVVFKALLDAEDVIDRAFSVTTPRASMEAVLAFDNLKLKVGEYLVEGGQVAAVSSAAAGAINFVADNLDALSDAIIVGSAALAGFFGAQGLMAVASGLNSVAVGATAGAKALALLRAAGAFLTGPVGIAIGAAAVASGIALIALGMGDVTEKSKTAEESILAVTDALGKYGEVNATIGRDLDTLKGLQDDLTKAIADQEPVIEATKRADIAALEERIAKNRELAGVYEALARAELANAKEKQGVIGRDEAYDLIGNGAFNVEEVPQAGARLRLKTQSELNDLLKEEYDRIRDIQGADGKGSVSARETRVLDYYSKRLAQAAKVAELEERVAALQAAGTGKPGGTDTGDSGGTDGKETSKADGAAIKALEDAWKKLFMTKRQLAEDTYQAELENIAKLGVEQSKKDALAQKALEIRDKTLSDIASEERATASEADQAVIDDIGDAWNNAFQTKRQAAEQAYQDELADIEKLSVAQSKKDELAQKALEVRDDKIAQIARDEQEGIAALLDARDEAAGNEIAIINRRAKLAKEAAERETEDAETLRTKLALIEEQRLTDIQAVNDKEAAERQRLIDDVLAARENALGDYESLANREYEALVAKIDKEITAEQGKYEILAALEEAHLETVKGIRERMAEDRLNEALQEADTVGEGFRAQWAIMREETEKAAGDIGILFADTFGPGGSVQEAIGQAAGRAIAFGDDFGESIENAARSIASDLIGALVQYGVQMVAQAALGQSVAAATTAATVAEAQAVE